MIINTCGWIDQAGYDLLLHSISTFRADTVLVLGNERLYSDLRRILGSLCVMNMPKSGGVVPRSSAFRRSNRVKKMRDYFYGFDNSLSPLGMVSTLSLSLHLSSSFFSFLLSFTPHRLLSAALFLVLPLYLFAHLTRSLTHSHTPTHTHSLPFCMSLSVSFCRSSTSLGGEFLGCGHSPGGQWSTGALVCTPDRCRTTGQAVHSHRCASLPGSTTCCVGCIAGANTRGCGRGEHRWLRQGHRGEGCTQSAALLGAVCWPASRSVPVARSATLAGGLGGAGCGGGVIVVDKFLELQAWRLLCVPVIRVSPPFTRGLLDWPKYKSATA
jgi:mRNA cleavage and polyadenylation factor CLP1 P-loop